MSTQSVQQFVLLPVRGTTVAPAAAHRELLGFFTSLSLGTRSVASARPKGPRLQMRVLDSIHENGAKLVEMPPDSATALRAVQPGMRLVPVVYYRPALAPRMTVSASPQVAAAKAGAKSVLTLVSRTDGKPITGATVVAFTDFASRLGDQGVTNKQGQVSLALPGAKKIQRLYVYPPAGWWSLLKRNVPATSAISVGLAPLDVNYKDGLRHFFGNGKDSDGAGVRVGVVDTGVGPHNDLQVDGGENTVVGENPKDFADNGHHHGTHVAGIIAAGGLPPAGIRGLAPGITLRSYRVFGKGADKASNYSIAKAIDRALSDGCDLINLSLGGGPADDATRAAIEDARALGSVVIAAAGNDGRQPVSYPAAEAAAVAVSAFGRKGTFPADSTANGDVMKPFGADKKNFVAAFSNIGIEIDLSCTGVDIISTVPGGYEAMSGTSMACPAVTGLAAQLLARRLDLLNLRRDQARSDAIIKALLQSARPLGFGAPFEGQGLP